MDVVSAIEVLGLPRRREIVRLVWSEERAAGDIHKALGDVTFGAISQHLRLLERAGLVEVRHSGRQRMYRARRESLGPLGAALEAMWDDALYRLKLAAELESGRRGPRPRVRRATRRAPIAPLRRQR
jgi:DNA-binding transcriptional ArsR family regulator